MIEDTLMRIIVTVNEVAEIGCRQTTALLIAAMVRRGAEVSLANVDGFSVDANCSETSENRFLINVARFPPNKDCSSHTVESFAKSKPEFSAQQIETGDLILIRTNPGRDSERASMHESLLEICRAAKSNGIPVVNDPAGLRSFASKASLASLDAKYLPEMIVSNQADLIADFVRRAEKDCVIKPLVGSRGHNVRRISPDTVDLESLVSDTYGNSDVIVQHFIPTDYLGDKRVVAVGGRVLEINGHLGGIERRPAKGEFRANLHTGGTAHPLALNEAERVSSEYAARVLHEQGIWIAGVDLVGDKIIELNVFSPGGLYDAERFSGINFCNKIVSDLVESHKCV